MEVLSPPTLEGALAALDERPQSVLLAGGTDVMVAMNFGRLRPERVIGLRRLGELKELSLDGRIRAGAGVPFSRLLEVLGDLEPAFTQAVRTVGSPQIRNAGTLGGNLGTCSPAGDLLPVLAALDADIHLRSQAATRTLKLAEFMKGPKRSDLRPGELVQAVDWQVAGGGCFLKAGTRNAMVIAVANLALVLDRAQRQVRVALGSVGPTVIRAGRAEEFARGLLDEAGWEPGRKPGDSALQRFGELAAAAAAPIDDVRGSARYRRHAVAVMAARALARSA